MKKPICVNVDGKDFISNKNSRNEMCYGCAGHGDKFLCAKLNSSLPSGSDCIGHKIIFIEDIRKQEVSALSACVADLEEKWKALDRPRKADIKRLNALVKDWEKKEEEHQRARGDAWPRSIRASQKLDCAALSRILKLLEQFQGA